MSIISKPCTEITDLHSILPETETHVKSVNATEERAAETAVDISAGKGCNVEFCTSKLNDVVQCSKIIIGRA